MRTIVGLAFVLVSGATGLAVSACGSDDCADTGSCGSYTGGSGGGTGATGGTGGGSGGDGSTCDMSKSPSEEACLISEEFGVFVSPTGNDATGDGTKQNPYKTLSKAVSEAGAATKNVYACDDGAGYTETATLTLNASFDGLGLFGGFDCADWGYSTTKKAKLNGAATALRIENVPASVRVEDFDISAANGSADGESSIGVFIASSQGVSIVRASVVAGAGALGAEGESHTIPAASGASGNLGKDACLDPNAGGAEVETSCDGTLSGSKGGKGGDGGDGTESGHNGTAGTPSGGNPGLGQALPGWGCGVGGTNGGGDTGGTGGDGPQGDGGVGEGSLSSSTYTSANGKPGQAGQPGKGGGGGGGAKAPTSGCSTGASAGSGGGGGCGGKGGGAGQGGGASIAVASASSVVTLTDVTLVAKAGGPGGNGGSGQQGGNGGDGGEGGNGVSSLPGCDGGDGGAGGFGGPGGGGAGGPSIGVAYTGTKPSGSPNVAVAAAPATGGADGTGATTGPGAGAEGLVEPEHQF